MEHRWGQRIEVAIPVRLYALAHPREHAACFANLSLSGSWIPANFGLRTLSRIRVVFDPSLLPLNSPNTVTAYVARQSHDGTALEWCEHSPDLIVRLLRAVAQREQAKIRRDQSADSAARQLPPR
jgi:hypothetical protein